MRFTLFLKGKDSIKVVVTRVLEATMAMALLAVSMYIAMTMVMALITGTIGVALTFLLGIEVLQLDALDLGGCIIVSNLAVIVAFLTTLQAERNTRIKQTFLQGNIRTWGFFGLLYVTFLIGLSPALWNFQALFILGLPLFVSGIFGVLIFGPIQDQIVRRSQKGIKGFRWRKKHLAQS